MTTPTICKPPSGKKKEARAIQALALYAHGRGDAPTARDCKLALDWIINQAAATYENGFLPEDPNGRIAAWVDGRQFVGQQIITMMKLKPEVLND